MADEFQLGSGNWWNSPRNRFDSASSSPSPPSMALNSIGSFGWQTEMVDTKPRSSMDSVLFQDTHKPDSSALLPDPNLQIMGLSLSSQGGMDWNQALLRSGKAESSFRSMLEEDMRSSTNFQQDQWRDKIYSASSDDSSANPRGFSLDQPQFSSHMMSPTDGSTVTCQSLPTTFQMDSAVYGNPSTMLLGLLEESDNQSSQQSTFQNQSTNHPYRSSYGMNNSFESLAPWSKFPQFLSTSPPINQPPLHFSNNARFSPAMNDVRTSFFPSLQMQLPPSTFDEKPKNLSENQNTSTVGKKGGNEPSIKRPRNETAPSPLPAFKVRKEKMGDRITALQQLVSPFGKTDTASVLSEAIEYIKFLHEQVSVLSSPYMKSAAPVQHHHQVSDKSNDPEGSKQDLRSRGLCLMPVSSTLPVVTTEATVDIWTPTFGGTFR